MMFAYHVSMFRTKTENVSVSFYGFYKEKNLSWVDRAFSNLGPPSHNGITYQI